MIQYIVVERGVDEGWPDAQYGPFPDRESAREFARAIANMPIDEMTDEINDYHRWIRVLPLQTSYKKGPDTFFVPGHPTNETD